ncbi:hypothetical protein C7271_20240 [filamentous cyanobacterium CCP5]|nr:hypothetical protein C7271_20240 [filamentous cyanobacterium CCP5]
MSSLPDHQTNRDIPVLVRQSSLETARAFAAEAADPTKGKQICLNTLSVLSVHEYLSILGIATDVTEGDGWQPHLRLIDNPADIYLAERGLVECIPVAPGTTEISVSPDVQFRRIAYVVVELQEPFQEAQLKGFGKASEITHDRLSIDQLHPISDLPQHLAKFHASHLGQWFQGHIESIWQPPEQIIATRYPAFRFRAQSGPILRKARPITLKSDVGLPLQLGLIIAAKSGDESIFVSAQLHPGIKSNAESNIGCTLPAGVVLELRSDEEKMIQAVSARPTPADTFIQLKPFECFPNEQYQICVILGHQWTTEILSA